MGKLRTLGRITRQTLLVLLITLVLAELAFRLVNYVRPSFVFYDRTYNRFRGKPNAPDFDFHLNSKGFKDVEYKLQKDPGTYRIVALGDSFAFGVVPYKYNYLTLLEEDLNKNGRKTEVINMGIAGTGPKDYLALLVNEALVLNPDRVLVSFFIGNDFLSEKAERDFYTYSYVASFVHYLMTLRGSYDGEVLFPNAEYDDQAPTFSDEKFFEIESRRSEIYRKENKQFESDFNEAFNYLTQIKQQCDSHGVALSVILIPDEVQINPSVQARVLSVKSFDSKAGDFDFTLPNRKMDAGLKELRIDALDLLQPFLSAAGQTVLYKPRDTHWNIAGNELAEELFAAHLLRESQPHSDIDSARIPAGTEGFLDEIDCKSVKGWAWNSKMPGEALTVDIYDGDTLIGTVKADLFRKDLLEAGKGNGAHAFDYEIPAKIKDGRFHGISAKFAGVNANLTGGPKQIHCPQK